MVIFFDIIDKLHIAFKIMLCHCAVNILAKKTIVLRGYISAD